jgi:hypothetical protein
MRDLGAIGMNVIAIAIPHLDTCRTLTLFHDLVERGKRRGEAVDRDDMASTRESRIAS